MQKLFWWWQRSDRYSLSLARAAASIIFVATNVLSRQIRVCRDTTFVATKLCLSRQNFCRDKYLSQQTLFCRDKNVFVVTKHVFCRDKSMTVATKLLSRQNYVSTINLSWESRGGRPGLSVLTSLMVSVDVKQYWTMLTHLSQLVPNNYVNRHPRTLRSLQTNPPATLFRYFHSPSSLCVHALTWSEIFFLCCTGCLEQSPLPN